MLFTQLYAYYRKYMLNNLLRLLNTHTAFYFSFLNLLIIFLKKMLGFIAELM